MVRLYLNKHFHNTEHRILHGGMQELFGIPVQASRFKANMSQSRSLITAQLKLLSQCKAQKKQLAL